MNDLKNYYEVLEVPSNARAEEIYQSYQRAKMAYSSDSLALYSLMSPDECRNVLDLVEEAYSILSDPQKRKRYDEARGLNNGFANVNYNFLTDRVEPIRSSRSPYTSASIPTSTGSAAAKFDESYLFNEQSRPQTAPAAGSGETNVTKLVTQQRFGLNFVSNADFEKEIEETLEFSGELLRKIREYKNVDLDRLADMTKVSRSHLQNIEVEDFSKLPAPVYVRGFVYQYAKCLKLKPDATANSYLARMKKLKP